MEKESRMFWKLKMYVPRMKKRWTLWLEREAEAGKKITAEEEKLEGGGGGHARGTTEPGASERLGEMRPPGALRRDGKWPSECRLGVACDW